MKKSINKKISILSLVALLVGALAPLFIGVNSAQAANFTQAYLRYDRMKASTATNVLVVITPVTAGTEAKIKVSFAAGTTVSTGTGNTANMPAGVIGVPGSLSVGNTNQIITISGVTDLTVGTAYGVNIATGITNGSAGAREDTITTTTSGDATIDTSNVATRAITDDQIVLLATVPPTFNFVLSGNSDAFTVDLDPAAVVSTAGKTVTVTTNADKGWIAWVKSANAALNSAITGVGIGTTGAVDGAPNTLPIGSNGYVLDVDVTTQGPLGIGTMTIDPEYNGTDTSSGGTLSTLLQPIASSDGTTNGDVMTLIARATISAVMAAADDYTDTLTVVGAGNF